ncbi:MAG: helix-turn-helix domain-containing protein [Rhodococcus sp. (in: high G+C Gram-positive bacteria)]|jgi:predicted transcriptional regulator|uniref:Helix-turn-helix domain-containing protein n=1 Tax=Rhodococcus sovatensis TaxID=1805840 RepID=A0ABZ2PP24_9NOCA|nr:helix-turn-helix domain-containing protein [Rhodococcus sp. EPR-157]KZF13115.1 transcriptional regulator [Rhodococcus sp. EPR-157]
MARSNAPSYVKGARITGDSRDRLQSTLKELYEAGASIRSLADRTGRSYGFVHKVLAESGTVLRSRGGPNRKKAGVQP